MSQYSIETPDVDKSQSISSTNLFFIVAGSLEGGVAGSFEDAGFSL